MEEINEQISFKFKNELINLTQWYYILNDQFVESVPSYFEYLDDFKAIRFIPETHYHIGFRKHISWDDLVIDAFYYDGPLYKIYELYNFTYDRPIYPYADLEKAKNQFDNFLLKFDKLKAFV